MAYVYQREDTVTLISNTSLFYSTKPFAQGRWYYEFTHLDGDNFHLIGFLLDGGQRIYIYPGGSQNKFHIIFFDQMSVEEKDSYEDLKFKNVTSSHTVGLGFDTYSKKFTIRYLDQILELQCSYSKSTKVAPQFGEGFDKTIHTDRVRYNFGKTTFEYEIPQNYRPWMLSNSPTNYCNCHNNIQYSLLFIIFYKS